MNDRPFILWKCAASLDGRIAAADGSSKWITSAEARADGHRLRAECGAVMVGSGTQQADDPQLAVRDAEVTRQPLRIVVDSNARTPASARVLDDAAPTLIAVLMMLTPRTWKAGRRSCGCRGWMPAWTWTCC
jgi:diaminohydroxyphosphoribosylaminopyrimidine deaminase / 5-amino-6-(5-phosphoribosylamino)uracil reductase